MFLLQFERPGGWELDRAGKEEKEEAEHNPVLIRASSSLKSEGSQPDHLHYGNLYIH